MTIGKDLYIQRYTESNISDYRKFKFSHSHEFYILQNQRFSFEKNIFIIHKKGFFGRVDSLGYAIISDLGKLPYEKKTMLAKASRVNEELFINHKGPYIEDFMIARRDRRKGLATDFFAKIKTFFPGEDFLLTADGDGLKFWGKVGFSYIDKSRYTMVLSSAKIDFR